MFKVIQKRGELRKSKAIAFSGNGKGSVIMTDS